MKIAIIGAGLSGLSCAYRLEQLEFPGTIDIFEKKPVVGGDNIFLEFVSEMFHRPIQNFFSYLAMEYNLYLVPQHTIFRSQFIGPSKSSLYEGFMGHVVVRGNHTNSLEKQLAKQIKSRVKCNQTVDADQIKGEYDFVIIATGRLQDVPAELGVRVDRYVHFYHGLLKGSFDVKRAKLWLNDAYAPKGNGFQLTLDEHTSMISLATPIRDFDLAKGWELFIQNEFGGNAEFAQVHEIRDFAIGQPQQYSSENKLFVGNVAGGVQPALGFGLHTAILSGIYAADSIVTNQKLEVLMEQHTKEYRWSLALRNALEGIGNEEYDWLVQGLDTIIGRAILRQGGFNINRFLGKLLATFTNENSNSIYPNKMNSYLGRTIFSSAPQWK